MTPDKSILDHPPTVAILLAKLQRAIDQERSENAVHRSVCQLDCREHVPQELLAGFTQNVTRVESWGKCSVWLVR
jgi:hypothetical protein